MRNKFTDLMANGSASFNYTPITSELPDTDPISRMYNNIFSIPTDTHMSITDNGDRVITGHIINTRDWEQFCCSCIWRGVSFKTTGFWSLCDFLYKHGLKGSKATLNGDIVYLISQQETDENGQDKCPTIAPSDNRCCVPYCCTTNESKIPHPITELTKSGNKLHITECFGCDINEVVTKMNESVWVKGSNWVPFENSIVGLVGEDVYKINLS
jgi:hypothetical protein